MSERRGLAATPLWQLTRVRMFGFLREPEAVFWVFAFPVLMALALGIAFRSSGPPRSRIGVVDGPGAAAVITALQASHDLEVIRVASGDAEAALRRGRIAVLVRPGDPGAPVLTFDPTRAETRLAQLATVEALEHAAGRRDVVGATLDTRVRAGSRYIDFLIPGLIGLNLLGTGMWGIGFPIATARQQKLLKRMLATPMRRSDYLLSLMLARLGGLVVGGGGRARLRHARVRRPGARVLARARARQPARRGHVLRAGAARRQPRAHDRGGLRAHERDDDADVAALGQLLLRRPLPHRDAVAGPGAAAHRGQQRAARDHERGRGSPDGRDPPRHPRRLGGREFLRRAGVVPLGVTRASLAQRMDVTRNWRAWLPTWMRTKYMPLLTGAPASSRPSHATSWRPGDCRPSAMIFIRRPAMS